MEPRYISERGQTMTQEACRLLRAACRGSLRLNAAGRWVVEYDQRPDRRTREALTKAEYIEWFTGPDYTGLRITDKGLRALTTFTVAGLERKAAS